MLGFPRAQTFCWHTILTDGLDSDAVVLDLGGNKGAFARAMITAFGCSCVVVEPVPDLFSRIALPPDAVKINAAICGESKPVTINIASQSNASSVKSLPDNLQAGSVTVQGYDLPTLVAEQDITRIDLVKCDIQGAEIDMFDSLSDDFLRKVKQITVEFHEFCDLVELSEVDRVIARMRALNFAHIQFSGACHTNDLFVNRALIPLSCAMQAYVRYLVRPALRMSWRVGSRVRRMRAKESAKQ